MKKIKYLLYFVSLLNFLPLATQAQWTNITKIDDFTDDQINYVVFIDNDHEIQISRNNDGSVWMYITRKRIGTIDPKGIIELRVDRNETMIIDPEKYKTLSEIMGKPTFQWEPMTVAFLLWHGKENEGCGYIGQLLNGDEFAFRYYINSMERESFRVSLNDAKEPIINGLNLKICNTE